MRAGFPLVLLTALFLSCGNAPEKHSASNSRYGGVFNLNETEALRSIFPLTLTQASSFRIMSQVYQGLVAFDPENLSVIPCIAEKWEVDATSTKYTFHLRQGVRFQDDPAFPDGKGRELNADDIIHCFNTICTQGPGDGTFWLFQDRVEGANSHYAASGNGQTPKEGVKGIERVDDQTVRITLLHPSPNFLQVIAHQGCWIWPKELITAYGEDPRTNAIGTGPFVLHEYAPSQVMVLERNPHYWGRDEHDDQLPYLDAVRITFNKEKKTEFEEFREGHVTALLELPVDRLRDLRDSVDAASGERHFVMRVMPSLTSQFYGFDIYHPPFNDQRVRRAFALAIDRQYLVDSVLGGMAAPAMHGIVAPGLQGYPYEEVPRIPFAPDNARKLMAEAGYPGGVGFPSIQMQLNADGFGYVQVAEALQTMLTRELNIPLSISVVPADRHYDQVDRGLVRFWREGWTADHPDPENFLALLYGKNAVLDSTLPASINKTRFNNQAFNNIFAKAMMTNDRVERLHQLALAEKIVMDEMPITPLYHEQAAYLMQPWVRGLHLNAIEYLDLCEVWFEKKEKPAP